MDFDFSEEQRLLDDSVRRLIRDTYAFDKRKSYMASPEGFSRDLWARYAAMGLLDLPFRDVEGGLAGSAIETMIVMESFGRGLALEPYLATVVLGGGLVGLAGDAAQRSTILPRVAAGKLLLAFAHTEPQSRYVLSDVRTSATRDGSGYLLNGRKSTVLHGEVADVLIVSARTRGGAASARASRCS